jgi:putative DNA primase/helicase
MRVTDLISSGLALVPIPLGQKAPIAKGWNLKSNSITRTQNAYGLDGMNIGLAHAYCEPAPTCAIDIDHYPSAKDWLATHCIELDTLLLASDVVIIRSGKKYSLKLLYRLPMGSVALETKQIIGSEGKMSLEFRCATKTGKTVQDVLPPSIHPSGSQYEWKGNGSPLALPTIPSELLQLWISLINKALKVSDRVNLSSIGSYHREESPRQVAIVTEALSFINADCSYDQWRNVIWAILSTGWTCAEGLAKNWSESAASRYDEDAFWLVVNSYLPNNTNPITTGSLIHHARNGGWHG